jgi:hypothetical protein
MDGSPRRRVAGTALASLHHASVCVYFTSNALIVSDVELTIRAALDGVGLAFALEEHVAGHLADGRLVRVLEDWCPPFDGFFLYYPSRRHQPPALLGAGRRAPGVIPPGRTPVRERRSCRASNPALYLRPIDLSQNRTASEAHPSALVPVPSPKPWPRPSYS